MPEGREKRLHHSLDIEDVEFVAACIKWLASFMGEFVSAWLRISE